MDGFKGLIARFQGIPVAAGNQGGVAEQLGGEEVVPAQGERSIAKIEACNLGFKDIAAQIGTYKDAVVCVGIKLNFRFVS
jgi:hypothetical protein